MKPRNKILFTAQDPGGGNALMPVIIALKKEKKLKVKNFIANESRLIFKRNKIKFLDCTNVSDEDLARRFEKFNPNIVVAATSSGLSIEKRIIKISKNNKIPVISIIDFWSSYKVRFSNPEKEDLNYLPDLICVIDENMKKEMEREGFNEKNIIVTGNPFFDNLKRIKKLKGKYFLFISQPFSEINNSVFNEVDILKDFVKIFEKNKIDLPLVIAFHPREKDRKKYDKIILNSNLEAKLSKKSGNDLIGRAEIVVGINSMALFLAAIQGKRVVSYQPGITKYGDVLRSNHLGISRVAYNYKDLVSVCKKLSETDRSLNTNGNARNKYVNQNSTKKVIAVINKFL